MARGLWKRISLIIAMLGVQGHSQALSDEVKSNAFRTEEAARAYLDNNPFGPRAKEAFLALVEFDLARDNPDFSLDEIRRGFATAVRRTARPSSAATTPTRSKPATTTPARPTTRPGRLGRNSALPY